MTEFRPCTDKSALYEIWRERFHDNTETIDSFFRLSFQRSFPLAVFENNIPVSVLYALPEKIMCNGIEFKALYIYAAATKKDSEHRGYMTKLLKYAEKTGKANGFNYLFLVPASKVLENYYKKRGFYSAFKELQIEYNSKETSTLKSLKSLKEDKSISRGDFTKAVNAVLWNSGEVDLSVEYSSIHFSNEHIWATGTNNSGKLHITDFMIKNHSLKEAFALLQVISDEKKLTFNIPYELKKSADKFSPTEVFKGMALNLSDSVPLLSDVYLGFTLA